MNIKVLSTKIACSILSALLIIFLFAVCADRPNTPAPVDQPGTLIQNMKHYDVVIYGGSFSAFSTIRTLMTNNPDFKVLMIVPQNRLGEIGTVAAQNFWDIMPPVSRYAGGTFKELYNLYGQGYDPDRMSAYLGKQVRKYKNIEIMLLSDISNVKTDNSLIKNIEIKKLIQNENGFYKFDNQKEPILASAGVYIDASYNGRLLRLSKFTGITGRDDYTKETRQQAVTLMFKVKGVDVSQAVSSGEWKTYKDKDDSRLMWGGWNIDSYKKIAEFNQKYRNFYRIKSINMAENKDGSYWVNMAVMYNVDATKESKDYGTERYPKNEYYSVDEAYSRFRNIIMGKEFSGAIKEVPGFENIKITGVADMLYVRESVHSSLKPNPSLDDFAVASYEVAGAGRTQKEGKDRPNYESRIGLGFYNMDNNGYKAGDEYADVIHRNAMEPPNPVYIPYQAVINPGVKNVLVCGYGANISSIAWFAMRVLPNQMILGDACGAAAGISLKDKKSPADFSAQEIWQVRKKLRDYGTVLDKE